MKKIILLQKALAVALVIFTCHSASAYEADFHEDGIYYNIISKDDRTVEVTNSRGGYSDDCYSEAEYTIPLKVISGAKKTYTVIAIGFQAFSGCRSLVSIDLPSSLTTINEKAFQSCSSLTSIDLPGSLTTIGRDAFRNCSSLASINIPSSVATIGKEAFWDCSSLASIDISSSVATIGELAFSKCSSLNEINVDISVPLKWDELNN